MRTRILHFDVFTTQPGKGNPAGIALLADHLGEGEMQRIAASTGFNDTAFVTTAKNADFAIRYFPHAKKWICAVMRPWRRPPLCWMPAT